MRVISCALRAVTILLICLTLRPGSSAAEEIETDGFVGCMDTGEPYSDDFYIQNTTDNCVIDSDINGKIDGDFTFEKRFAVEAKFDLLDCLRKAGAYIPGRGTKVTLEGRKILCECQQKVVKEKISCDFDFGSPITQDECERIKKILENGGMATMSVFKGGSGHDLEITELKCNFNGFVGVFYRDPNAPGKVQTGIIDPNDGSFTSSTSSYNGGTNGGHYAVEPR
ncbi:MAG: hypothetical protein KDD66_06390 [Bdellovibrionales bacterium]|nr:hypothetical protein [Bdellovibrionales bacterium]